MPNIRAEHYQPSSTQDIAQQRLAASRQDLRLYAHLLQASFVVEHENPLRQALARASAAGAQRSRHDRHRAERDSSACWHHRSFNRWLASKRLLTISI